MEHPEFDPDELFEGLDSPAERVLTARASGRWDLVAKAEDWDADIEYELSRENGRRP